ncbi:MAG: formate acetyltransferase [Desulfobacterales bacterium]|nr:formate acetyltransferase [Desulfobacterales bacterium]
MLLEAEPAEPITTHTKTGKTLTHLLLKALLRTVAANFNLRPGLRRYLKAEAGWFDFTVGIRTESRSVETAIRFRNGRVRVLKALPDDCGVTLIFASDKAVRMLLSATPTEQIFMLMKSKMRTKGNQAYMMLFLFYLSLLIHKKQKKQIVQERDESQKALHKDSPTAKTELSDELRQRRAYRMRADSNDPGVKYLAEPFLSDYSLEDFPRIKDFIEIHFNTTAEVCPERPRLVTEWFKTHGFETNADGSPWIPELRQGYAFKYLMENREPIIRKNDLIAGTTTTKEIGVVVYPDSHGTMIWSELLTVPHRSLNPYGISRETVELLHKEVFPFWIHRNFREWVREKYDSPLCQAIDERFAVYFIWKQAALSHTIPDFPKILRLGATGVIDEIKQELAAGDKTEAQTATLEAMILCLEAMIAYGTNLAAQAESDAEAEADPKRRAELAHLAEICRQVPAHPARSLDEAVNAMWITWVGLHMENTNAGLSLGRLDQWLQPYFEADMAALETDGQRRDYIRHAIEMVACFFMRCTDHLPLTPDLANWYFGGSSSDQAITLGGVTPDGRDAVCDMTYIFLKVTEMLSIRDPNVNARFHPGINSDTYLKRLCEVNLITAATPSMHNDAAVMTSLEEFDYAPEDLRNWSATGCVEPTLSGRHIGHTNFQMMNMVAALEMALNNGRHPLMNWKLGPDTGVVENDGFKTFDQFLEAFFAQFRFLIEQSIEYNNMLGKAHQAIRPTPFLSSLIEDCIPSGTDVTHGGARYNSSGAACIGLADVTDSLMVIKKLVFDEKRIGFKALKKAVDENFENAPDLYALATKKVPLFGSDNDEAVEMASRITRFTHDTYGSHTNYRGGSYTAGFWSMSNHVIYGTLSCALPSGKLTGKPFTPGLTPEPHASTNLLDNIRDVARLDPHHMNNNIAFNVKVVPGGGDRRENIIDRMFSYVKTYFDLGGMQMQMNVVTSETLKDAMAHPENYRNLLVRISGYNAYFVTLNSDLQKELIERAEYGL